MMDYVTNAVAHLDCSHCEEGIPHEHGPLDADCFGPDPNPLLAMFDCGKVDPRHRQVAAAFHKIAHAMPRHGSDSALQTLAVVRTELLSVL